MYLALDIGGTFVKYAWMEKDGTMLNQGQIATITDDLEAFYASLLPIAAQHTLQGIAISSPGVIDSQSGLIRVVTLIPCLNGVNIKKDGTSKTVFNAMSYNDVSRETIDAIWPELTKIPEDIYEQIEIEARYSGYIKRQLADIEIFKKDENLKLRDDIDYGNIGGLSREMVAKLSKVRPSTIGEASRIPGVTPAAITAILGYVKK